MNSSIVKTLLPEQSQTVQRLVSQASTDRPIRSRRIIGRTMLLVMVSNLAVILWLWSRDGNVLHLHSVGDVFTSLGRVSGLLAAYLALIQILLLARLPFLERLVGFDRLTIWHRANGKACFSLILAHITLIVTGYTLLDRIPVTHEIRVLLTTYPGIIAATIGTALFILVVASSLVIVRRRLRYEAWYAVHLMSYTAIVLAWFHQIETGNEFISNPAAANYWKCLYLLTGVLLLLFRVVQPIAHALWYQMRVDRVIVESSDVVSLIIKGRRLDRLPVRAGQFFLFRFLDRGRWWESHPFSLSAAPDGHCLRITVKNLGDFTQRLGAVRPGTRVITEGPFGIFTAQMRGREGTALIAGGIGITPIRALLEELTGDVVLIYRAQSDGDLLFHAELEELSRRLGFRLVCIIGDHRTPGNERLLSPEHLLHIIPDIANRDVFVCGPAAMSDAVQRSLQHAGVPSASIHAERFAL